MSKSGGMTSHGQCPRGGGVLVNVPPPFQEILYPRLGPMNCAAPGPALALDDTGYNKDLLYLFDIANTHGHIGEQVRGDIENGLKFLHILMTIGI